MQRTRGRRRGGRRGRRGFTIVEVMITLVVLLIALAGYSRSVVSTMVAADTDEELRRATEGARGVMERLQGEPFAQVFALFNDDPDDDPPGREAWGSSFAIEGLDAGAGAAAVGEVLLPVWIDAGGTAQLREDLQIPALGMPRDLNGDGAIDGLDHSDDYVILPVRVRLEWRGVRGPSHLELHTLLSGL